MRRAWSSPNRGRKEDIMGMRADLIREMSPQIRKLFYNDSHYCRDVETRKYDRYNCG